MTSVASGLIVRAEQRESRQAVIEKHVILPCTLVVTIVAYDPQGLVVRIIRRMTSEAPAFKRDIENRFDVARGALDRLVRAVQRVVRVDVVIEVDRRPLFITVTLGTFRTKMAIVRVIVEMTSCALRIQRVGKRIGAMAGVAGEIRMPAKKRKIRVAIMIEPGIEPSGGRVAVLALITAATVVYVVLGMAAETIVRGADKGLVFVAVQAGWLPVFADQGITGRIVVEFHSGPVRGSVAVTTGIVKRVAVHVIVEMAVNTGQWRVPMFFRASMAGVAIRIGMRAEQLEVGERVIE